MIPENLVSFFEDGISIVVGSPSADRIPSIARAVGASLAADRIHMTVLLPGEPARALLGALEASRRAAVVFSRPIDHRALQVKGTVTAIRPGTERERERAAAYRLSYSQQLALVGISPCITARLAIDPCVAVEIRVEEIFRQTPGPDAGSPLLRGARS